MGIASHIDADSSVKSTGVTESSSAQEKILFVDDEPSVLDGFKRILYREFDVDTAVGGQDGLAAFRERGPYAVVVSDMRMPGMSGAQFLAQVRRGHPNTVRMLLTGYTDMNAAIDAVNEGNIFRFLTKPCEKANLARALSAGLDQYRLISAEKELLEKTLMGSIKALSEVLNAANPEAFGRSMRITKYVRHMVEKLRLALQWRFEAAAMLSQLGCVTLDPELIRVSYIGDRLSSEDRARFEGHPKAAQNLLANIPRLEEVVWMIGQQLNSGTAARTATPPAGCSDDCKLGAEILQLAIVFDNYRMKGLSLEDALARVRDRRGEFKVELIAAMAEVGQQSCATELRKVLTSNLTTGMVLQQEIRTSSGMLVVPKGQEITQALLMKLDNFSAAGMIDREVLVQVPA